MLVGTPREQLENDHIFCRDGAVDGSVERRSLEVRLGRHDVYPDSVPPYENKVRLRITWVGQGLHFIAIGFEPAGYVPHLSNEKVDIGRFPRPAPISKSRQCTDQGDLPAKGP